MIDLFQGYLIVREVHLVVHRPSLVHANRIRLRWGFDRNRPVDYRGDAVLEEGLVEQRRFDLRAQDLLLPSSNMLRRAFSSAVVQVVVAA